MRRLSTQKYSTRPQLRRRLRRRSKLQEALEKESKTVLTKMLKPVSETAATKLEKRKTQNTKGTFAKSIIRELAKHIGKVQN